MHVCVRGAHFPDLLQPGQPLKHSHVCQVEVKLRLPDRAAYEKVAQLLASVRGASYAQVRAVGLGLRRGQHAQIPVLRQRAHITP